MLLGKMLSIVVVLDFFWQSDTKQKAKNPGLDGLVMRQNYDTMNGIIVPT